MPNNIKSLKRKIRQRIRAEGGSDVRKSIQADLQKRVVTLMLTNLLRLTNVDKGILAGGWTVKLRGSVGNRRAARNRSFLPNAKQFAPIDKIKGNSTVNIVNSVEYAGYVNRGTTSQPPSLFAERAALVTTRQLKALGIKLKVSGSA